MNIVDLNRNQVKHYIILNIVDLNRNQVNIVDLNRFKSQSGETLHNTEYC